MGTLMLKKKQSTLLIATALALTACGGGGSSSTNPPVVVTPPTPVATAGKAIDGYLSGSTAFCDTNSNGVADTGEVSVTTDTGGNYRFPNGCASPVVVTGGKDVATGFAFNGTLKTPAGSTVATPLTSLMADSGMTAAQLATALGLPAGTDVTKTDPLVGNNESLLRVTLATQQLIQQLANMLAGQAGTTNLADVYSKVGKSLATTLQANPTAPLFSSTGTINTTHLVTASKAAVTALAANTAYKPVVISDANLAAAAQQVTTQATKFLTASAADLANVTKELQNPQLPVPDAAATTSYLALASDSVVLNGTPVTYAALKAGVTIATPTTFGLNFSVQGNPTINSVSALALELKEDAGQGRVLQVMIDKVNIKSAAGQISIEPAANAVVYVYGKTGTGNVINMTLADLTFKPISVVNNALNLNYKALVNKVLASADSSTKLTAEKFVDIKGNFGIAIAVDGLPVRTANGANLIDASTVTITGTTPVRSVVGLGVAGKLIIQ